MSQTEIQKLVTELQTLVTQDPVLFDVMHLFSIRTRARYIVTLDALHAKLLEEGFKHSKAQLVPVFVKLAAAGVGTLDTGPKGNVRAIKGIRVSIPDLGKAVLQGGKIKAYRQRSRFQRVVPPAPPKEPETVAPRAERQPRAWQIPSARLVATVLGTRGQVVANVTFNEDASKEEIVEFFASTLLSVPDSTKER